MRPILPNPFFGGFAQLLGQAIETIETAYNNSSAEHALYSNDEGWVLQLDAAGYDKEEINLKYEDDALLINAETEDFYFNKKFMLGKDVDTTSISAKLENGVLEITLPKTNPTTNINID